jgi:putative hydrolase of the HAD superfamily
MTRGVIFDLDDTLYPRRRFLQSGFAAVARHLAVDEGLPLDRVYTALWRAHQQRPGLEFQALCAEFGLPDAVIPSLVQIVRGHTPSLWLGYGAADTLTRLRAHGWRLGIVTNGAPRVQARKVRALGLAALVDHIVYAETVAPGGKPGSATFVEALWCLEVAASNAVCVGDDLVCDIHGARRAGLHTIRLAKPGQPDDLDDDADFVVDALAEVPAAALALVEGAMADVA